MNVHFPIEIVPYADGRFALVGRDHAEVCVCLYKEVAEYIKFALDQMPKVLDASL
jgi:hypothetical protein